MLRASFQTTRKQVASLRRALPTNRRVSVATASTTMPTEPIQQHSPGAEKSLLLAGLGACVAGLTLHQQQNAKRNHCEASEYPNNKQHPKQKKEEEEFRVKDVYDIEHVLGEGAYGMVYQARRKSDGVAVALKTLPREYTGQTDFEREVAALQLLSKQPHQHVVRLYDLHRDGKNYYLAMELVEGGELLEHLIQNGPYSEATAASFLRQFAEAICFVHSMGLSHADLKPENLMLMATSVSRPNEPLSLKLVDFGCACAHDANHVDMRLPAHEFAQGCSFLHQVALGNQFELQRILQDQPKLVNFRDYDMRTPLHLAASEGHLDVCRFLVQRGARLNRIDRWGGSPLDDAYRHGHELVVQFLGEHGALFGSAAATLDKSNSSSTAQFIEAASHGNVEQVRAMIQFGKVNLNKGDYDRRTALHLAAGEGRLAMLRLLCEAGADVNVKDRWGNRPLDDAKRSSKHAAEMVEVLKQHGAIEGGGAASEQLDEAKPKSQTLSEIESNDVPGTIAYWPPELFSKGARPTPAADMWATGVIVYILLTGSHPFDKHGDRTDEEIAQAIVKVGRSSKNAFDEDEQNLNLIDKLVFDERIEGLSDSCVDLIRHLMHPDPEKRMTSDNFRRHPWVQGLTASWKIMGKTHADLQGFWQGRFRTELVKAFTDKLGIANGHDRNGEALSEQDVKAIFDALDRDQSGKLDMDEIAHFFRKLGFSEKNIQQMFASADLDGTGIICWDEFRALMSKQEGGKDHGLQVEYLRNKFKSDILKKFGKSQKDNLREIFNAIDLEGNGVLDAHEIRVVLRSTGEPEDVISRIVASLDSKRNGGVGWEEFQEVMGLKVESN